MGKTIDIKQEIMPVPNNEEPNVIILKFADAVVPVFKETRNKDYIKYGENNYYPEYLIYLYNKSSIHNAITNGKAYYIFGKGYENGDMIVNRSNESLNDIAKKCILDIEIFGGFKLEIIWNKAGRIAEIYHVDFSCIRKGKDSGFYYKETWKIENRDEELFIPAFDPANPQGSQIYEYNEYRPGGRFYPLPGYIACNNAIETHIEIGKFRLSSMRNGLMPSKMIQFFKGDPPDEKKRELERRFSQKFAGTENAGKIIMVFNDSNQSTPVAINDLSDTNMDKMFIEVQKATDSDILTGHGVTSPMLFGIKTEGQLGGATELNVAYSIFQNTYAEPKSNAFDKEINWLLSFSAFKGVYKLQPTDPVGFHFDAQSIVNSLPKEFVFKELGIPEEMWDGESIGGDVVARPFNQDGLNGIPINDNLKNLTGKQSQGIDRIFRKYNTGKITRAQAVTLLKKGFGLDDEDIIAFLGEEPKPLALSFEDQLENTIAVYDEYGESKKDFEVVKSRKICCEIQELEDDEKIYVQEAFKTYDVTITERRILELIKKDPLITSEVIAKTIGETKAWVESKIKGFLKKGYLETTIEKIGEDEIIKRIIPTDIDIDLPPVKKGTTNPTQIYIKYSYEGPQDSRNRPFCAKMMQLNRLYSRYDIEKISQRLGYSVFDRRGGFWTQPDGSVLPHCRHNWKSNIVIKKGGNTP